MFNFFLSILSVCIPIPSLHVPVLFSYVSQLFRRAPLWQLTEVTVCSHLSVNHRQPQGSKHSCFSTLHPSCTNAVTRTMTETMANNYDVLSRFARIFKAYYNIWLIWKFGDWQDVIIFCQVISNAVNDNNNNNNNSNNNKWLCGRITHRVRGSRYIIYMYLLGNSQQGH